MPGGGAIICGGGCVGICCGICCGIAAIMPGGGAIIICGGIANPAHRNTHTHTHTHTHKCTQRSEHATNETRLHVARARSPPGPGNICGGGIAPNWPIPPTQQDEHRAHARNKQNKSSSLPIGPAKPIGAWPGAARKHRIRVNNLPCLNHITQHTPNPGIGCGGIANARGICGAVIKVLRAGSH